MNGEARAGGGRDTLELGAHRTREWARLYHAHGPAVRRFIASHVQCPHEVEDLVHGVFVAAMTQGSPPRHAHAYLRKVATHHLFADWRRKRRTTLGVCIACALLRAKESLAMLLRKRGLP